MPKWIAELVEACHDRCLEGHPAYQAMIWLASDRERLTRERDEAREEPRKLTQYPNGCWVACIAGLTGLDHGDLALLVPLERTRDTYREYNNAVVRYMRERGWRVACLGEDIPKGYAIASGMSPRGVKHAVIVKDGELWHDPHPDGGGITGVYEYEICAPLIGNLDPLINDAIRERAARTEKEGTNARTQPQQGTAGSDLLDRRNRDYRVHLGARAREVAGQAVPVMADVTQKGEPENVVNRLRDAADRGCTRSLRRRRRAFRVDPGVAAADTRTLAQRRTDMIA